MKYILLILVSLILAGCCHCPPLYGCFETKDGVTHCQDPGTN